MQRKLDTDIEANQKLCLTTHVYNRPQSFCHMNFADTAIYYI